MLWGMGLGDVNPRKVRGFAMSSRSVVCCCKCLGWAMLFVVGAVLRVVILCVATGFSLSGVIGFSSGGFSADRHLWASRGGFVLGASAVVCRVGVAGLLILLGGLNFDITWPLHFV